MWLEELFIYYRHFLYQTGNSIRLRVAEEYQTKGSRGFLIFKRVLLLKFLFNRHYKTV